MNIQKFSYALITQAQGYCSSARSKAVETYHNAHAATSSLAQKYLTKEYITETALNSVKTTLLPWWVPVLEAQKADLLEKEDRLITFQNGRIREINKQIESLDSLISKTSLATAASFVREKSAVTQAIDPKLETKATPPRRTGRKRSSSRSPVRSTSPTHSNSPSPTRKTMNTEEIKTQLEFIKIFIEKRETEQIKYDLLQKSVTFIDSHLTAYEKHGKILPPCLQKKIKEFQTIITCIPQLESTTANLNKIPAQIAYLNKQIQTHIAERFIGWAGKVVNVFIPGTEEMAKFILTLFSEQTKELNLDLLPEDAMKCQQRDSVSWGRKKTIARLCFLGTMGYYVTPVIRAKVGI